MFSFLRTIFGPGGFEPHSVHFVDNPGSMWLMVYANALIVLSYVLIPVALVYIVRKRKDLVFNWVFLLFGLFIFLCGVTHLMHIVVFWYPAYYLQGIIEALTVIASGATFFALLTVLPRIVTLTSPEQLDETRKKLAYEIEDQKKSEEELSRKILDFNNANKEIREKNDELLSMNQLMLNRDKKLDELKKEIEELKKKK